MNRPRSAANEINSPAMALAATVGGLASQTLVLSGGAVKMFGSMSAGQSVTMAGGGNWLVLGNPGGFAASIAQFGAGDVIDLVGLGGPVASGVVAGSATTTLTVTGGAGQVSLSLLGSYSAASFVVGTDGAGGVLVQSV